MNYNNERRTRATEIVTLPHANKTMRHLRMRDWMQESKEVHLCINREYYVYIYAEQLAYISIVLVRSVITECYKNSC